MRKTEKGLKNGEAVAFTETSGPRELDDEVGDEGESIAHKLLVL